MFTPSNYTNNLTQIKLKAVCRSHNFAATMTAFTELCSDDISSSYTMRNFLKENKAHAVFTEGCS